MLEGDSSRDLFSLEHYKIQPFGYVLRSQLIEKWFSLYADVTIDEANIISRCDQAERLVNMVMKRTVIPSIPLYLLILLQSIEAGHSGDFKESSLGHYYHYLLTEAFYKAGVKSDKLNELFHYSACLAWNFNTRKKYENYELSEFELRDFNKKFSNEWHTVEFDHRLKILLNSGVLCRIGEDYAFRYPYIYYYLKGKYLSEKLYDLDTRAYIRRCCEHLYVRDHANTILFLAHHTNDEYILNTISETINSLFRFCLPLTFKGDTIGIDKLIENSPKIIYSGESPSEHRKRRNILQDDFDDGQDGLLEKEEDSSILSRVAQITALFKTTEILGQVLKNQYAMIQRVKKRNLLEQLFNGPLRALRDLYDYFEKHPDSLATEIEAIIEQKGKINDDEKRQNIVRQLVANIFQIITFCFIMRAAQGANSDSLLEDVQDIVKKNGTLSFRLIELCIYLDSPKDIPRKKITVLLKEIGKNSVAIRLVQLMVLHRLYMFKTKEQDMQWLSQKLDIEIGVQHAINYGKSRQRLIE